MLIPTTSVRDKKQNIQAIFFFSFFSLSPQVLLLINTPKLKNVWATTCYSNMSSNIYHLSVTEILHILSFSLLERPMCHPCYNQGFMSQNT